MYVIIVNSFVVDQSLILHVAFYPTNQLLNPCLHCYYSS
jgi:hypothetical protein